MKRIIFILSLLPVQLCFPQDYEYTVGLRGGATSGLTVRHLSDNGQAFEGIISFPGEGIKVTGLKESFRPWFTDYFNNVTFIKGYGAHVGIINTDSYTLLGTTYYWKNKVVGPLMGIDGYLGVEYRFMSFPLSVGLDYKPFLDFSTIQYFSMDPWDFAFTIKYSFK